LLPLAALAWLVSTTLVHAQPRLARHGAQSTTPPPSIDEFLARCPTIEEVAAVNQNFTLIFDADPTHAEPLACTQAGLSVNLTRFQKRVYQGLIAMQKIQFDAPLPWTSLPLSEWFRIAVGGIHFRSDVDGSSCCEAGGLITVMTANSRADDHSCLTAGSDPDPKIWINSQVGCGVESFIALLAHEARHNEGYGHTCASNDNTINEMGAWAVEYYTLSFLADHTWNYLRPIDGRPTTTYRDYMRGAAHDICSTRFCLVGCPKFIHLKYGLQAVLGNINLSNGASIDSFNSFNGPWGAPCRECPDGVNIAGAGNLQAAGTVEQDRTVVIKGTVQTNTRPETEAIAPPDGATNLGDYSLGRDQSAVLPAGDYVADTLTMTDSAHLTAQGGVRIWVRRTVSLGGRAMLDSQSGSARDLWLIAMPGMRQADLSDQVQFTGVLYAPETPVNVRGACNLSGSLTGAEVVISGATQLHFDEDLIGGSLMEPLPVPPRSR
jgi:hypothetical protein